ncbi:TetR/AcrR family transcriptional regulator [Yinghuangia sp. KLBMP8922]|uniref:TetR/AcrR family transcriptional regulator n=1 Tax=Yinghuangia soli TaxID=2908204 RepID=A0AA41U465_9ACTN|nr:TetR/AcrR family transcriptional regulator [Yinghuangia soli]
MARNRRATLADIAQAAEVGRSTLHRYFPDRDELVSAAVEDSLAHMAQALEEAAIDQGPALDAMRRLATALVGAGDRLVFVFGDPHIFEQLPDEEDDPTDRQVLALIERGQAEGAFDPEADPVWIRGVLWALVYTGAEMAARGTMPRHVAAANTVRTLERGICAAGGGGTAQ